MSEIRKPAPREIIPEARSERVKLSLTKADIFSLPLLPFFCSREHIFFSFPSFFFFFRRKFPRAVRLPIDFRLGFVGSIEIFHGSGYRVSASVQLESRLEILNRAKRARATVLPLRQFSTLRSPLVNTNGKEMELPHAEFSRKSSHSRTSFLYHAAVLIHRCSPFPRLLLFTVFFLILPLSNFYRIVLNLQK